MKRALFVTLLGMFFLIGVTAAMSDNPETITLENSKGTVVLPHKAHQDAGYTCKTCHHTLEGEADTPDKMCHDCHTGESEVTVKKAFHGSCTGCHKAYKKEHKKTTAPTSCSKCHKKKK